MRRESRTRFAIPLVLVVWATMLSAFPSATLAQTSVRGVLFDSLLTGKSVADAEVVLIVNGTGRRTTTDRRGRFSFDDVPAGTHRVAFRAAWLDSVALPTLEREVTVASDRRGVEVALATPSLARFQRTLCGAPLAQGEGIVLGEVRSPDGTPLAGLPTWATWEETILGVGQLNRRNVATIDTTSTGGFFALCGVPLDAEVALRTGTESLGSNELALRLGNESVRRRDIVAAGPGAQTLVRGRVLAPDGATLAAATVTTVGDSARSATTDATGRFALDRIQQRSTQILVRALGFEPLLVSVDPVSAPTELADIRLVRMPFELSRVTVDGRVMSPEELGYEHRKRMGMGVYFDEDEIKRYPQFGPTALGTRMPRAQVSCPNASACGLQFWKYKSFVPTLCTPELWVNGRHDPDTAAVNLAAWLQRAKRVEVYRAPFVPVQFSNLEDCGSVVVWTR